MVPYVVQSGDTLSLIAGRLYGDEALYTLIQKANNIVNANLIFPGDHLIIPDKPVVENAPSKNVSASSTPAAATSEKVAAKPESDSNALLWIGGSLVVVGGIVLLVRYQKKKKRGMGRVKRRG